MKLSGIFRALKTETSKQLKGDHPRFWQLNYYDFNVFTQPKFREKLRYIHRNPLKRGLVEKPEDWQWSSYRHWLNGKTGRVQIESDWTWNARVVPGKPLIDQQRMSNFSAASSAPGPQPPPHLHRQHSSQPARAPALPQSSHPGHRREPGRPPPRRPAPVRPPDCRRPDGIVRCLDTETPGTEPGGSTKPHTKPTATLAAEALQRDQARPCPATRGSKAPV